LDVKQNEADVNLMRTKPVQPVQQREVPQDLSSEDAFFVPEL
jgi:hypothetical protein